MSDDLLTTAPVNPRTVEITSDVDGHGRIVVDGQDLSMGVSSINVDVSAGDVPEVSLRLNVGGLTRFHGAANVDVDTESAAVLRLLGWTPPAEPLTRTEVAAAAQPIGTLAEHLIRAALHRLVAGDVPPTD